MCDSCQDTNLSLVVEKQSTESQTNPFFLFIFYMPFLQGKQNELNSRKIKIKEFEFIHIDSDVYSKQLKKIFVRYIDEYLMLCAIL